MTVTPLEARGLPVPERRTFTLNPRYQLAVLEFNGAPAVGLIVAGRVAWLSADDARAMADRLDDLADEVEA